MKCFSCNEDIVPGEKAQRIPRPDIVLVGGKSGLEGLYPDPDFYEDDAEVVIHAKCCSAFFDPESNPYLYDEYVDRLRETVTDDIREELREEFQNFCASCSEALPDEEEEVVACLWCKQTDHVWSQARANGIHHCCFRCQRYWNEEDEQEVAA